MNIITAVLLAALALSPIIFVIRGRDKSFGTPAKQTGHLYGPAYLAEEDRRFRDMLEDKRGASLEARKRARAATGTEPGTEDNRPGVSFTGAKFSSGKGTTSHAAENTKLEPRSQAGTALTGSDVDVQDITTGERAYAARLDDPTDRDAAIEELLSAVMRPNVDGSTRTVGTLHIGPEGIHIGPFPQQRHK